MSSDIPAAEARPLPPQRSRSYDGQPDKLSLIKHTYEEHRVGAPPLLHIPLETSPMIRGSELYQRYSTPEVKQNIEEILK